MTKTIKVALAGAGAFGIKHLDGIRKIDGVEVVSLVGRRLEPTQEVAAQYGIGHVTTDLAEALALPEVDAVILCTPTQMHAAQAIQCMQAGKHVLCEKPLGISVAETEEILGATVFSIDSQELINFVALAMRLGAKVSDLRDGIWTHPSSTEGFNEVLGELEPLT